MRASVASDAAALTRSVTGLSEWSTKPTQANHAPPLSFDDDANPHDRPAHRADDATNDYGQPPTSTRRSPAPAPGTRTGNRQPATGGCRLRPVARHVLPVARVADARVERRLVGADDLPLIVHPVVAVPRRQLDRARAAGLDVGLHAADPPAPR